MPARRFAVLIATLLASAACTPARESRTYTPPTYAKSEGGLRAALDEELAADLKPGHDAELVKNGRVFDVLVEEIRKAKQSIHILVFIWRPGRPSDRILEVVTERARAGVQCRILVEQVGSPKFHDEVWPKLEAAGCAVRFYKPVGYSAVDEMIERNHRKIVMIDGQVGLTGGFGIWKSWEGDGKLREEWRDDSVLVRGPVVSQMQHAFNQNWIESGGDPLPQELFEASPVEANLRAAFIASSDGPNSEAKKMTYLLIAGATKRLWIANSYFVPSDQLIGALLEKVKQGVEVRILAPGQIHDVPPVLAAQRASYERLVRGGVRIWEYQPTMMHSKTMLVDDKWVVIGSTNLDPFSLEQLEEGSVIVESKKLADELENAWEEDLHYATAIRNPKRTLFQELSRRLLWIFGRGL